jgi:hypothetical protein
MVTAESNIPKVIDVAKDSIEKAYQQWLTTGIYYDGGRLNPDGSYNYDRSDLGVPNFIVRRIVRQAAKELKRPFVVASEYIELHGMDWKIAQDLPRAERRFKVITTSLKIPNRKYLSPIITPLLMAGTENKNIPWSERTKYPILKHVGPSVVSIVFTDQKLFNEYTHEIQTREEMRAALRMPT